MTLNDPQYVEAARALADRAITSSRTFDERLDDITLPLLSRRLSAEERETVRPLEKQAMANYERSPADAVLLTTVGDSRPSGKHKPAELATWTLVASEIMNTDECLTK